MNKEWIKSIKHFYLHNADNLSKDFISHMDIFIKDRNIPEDGTLFNDDTVFEQFLMWEHDAIKSGQLQITDDNINSLRGIENSMQKDRSLKEMDTSIIDEFSATFGQLAKDPVNYIETDEELQRLFEKYVEAKGKSIKTVLSEAALSATGSEVFKLSNTELRAKLNSMSSSEITEMLVKQMEKPDFEDSANRQEFFKSISGFGSNHYTLRNRLILQMQAEARMLLPVFGTYKEFKEKKWQVSGGEKGMLVCIPNKFDIYYQQNDDGSWNQAPYPVSKNQKAEYEKKAEDGTIVIKHCLSFMYLPNIFSLTQTCITEQERNAVIQRYNAHNTSEENKEILKKLEVLTKKLGIEFVSLNRKIEATGFIDSHNKKMYIDPNMPIDAKISVVCHELGHYFLHRDIDKFPEQYQLDHRNKELQAELFSHIALESLGVDSESKTSLKYLHAYLPEDDLYDGSLQDVKKDMLYCHIAVVRDLAVSLKDTISQDVIDQGAVDKLEQFEPNFVSFNKFSKKSYVVSRKDYEQELNENNNILKTPGKQIQRTKQNVMVMERGE